MKNSKSHRAWTPVSRNIYSDYLTLKGLEAQIGLEENLFFIYAVKELSDNALDEVDRLKEPHVIISIHRDEKSGTVRVWSNADFSADVKDIFDYTKRRSGKFYTIAPFRGSFGSALQYLACIAHVYPAPHGKSSGHLVVRTKGLEYKITNPRIEQDEALRVDIDQHPLANFEGTEVEVKLPGNWAFGEAIQMPYELIVFNPHLNFKFFDKKYERVSPLTLMKDTSIHYYSSDEFKELAEKYKHEDVYSFCSRFHATKVRDVLGMVGKGRKVTDVPIADLHKAMVDCTPAITAENLGVIGSLPFERRLEQIVGRIGKKKYVVKKGFLGRIPFVVEVLTAAVEGVSESQVWFGINQSVPPNKANILKRYNIKKGSEIISLDSVLRKSGIQADDPVVMVVHLYIPRIFYPSFSKAAMDAPIEVLDALFDAIGESSKWYRGYKSSAGKTRTDWDLAINTAIAYIEELNSKGIKPTLRHVYYRMAFKEQLISQTRHGYSYLDAKLVDARKSGLLPVDSLSDRSRYVEFSSPEGKSEDIIQQFLDELPAKVGFNPWDESDTYVEVWLEKDALVDLIGPVTRKYMVPLAPQRGYSGLSYVYEGVQRIKEMEDQGKKTVILSLGDHDPSGDDIYEKLKEAMREFGLHTTVVRLALTDEQIAEYNLPAAPAKESDPRYHRYLEKHHSSKVYELDAMDPQILREIMEEGIKKYVDPNIWERVKGKSSKERERAKAIAKKISRYLKSLK